MDNSENKSSANIVVFRGDIAKTLFHEGYKLVDFGPNTHNPITTVFVFKNVLGLEERLNQLKEQIKNKDKISQN